MYVNLIKEKQNQSKEKKKSFKKKIKVPLAMKNLANLA